MKQLEEKIKELDLNKLADEFTKKEIEGFENPPFSIVDAMRFVLEKLKMEMKGEDK